MRALFLVLLMFGEPALAADYLPWPGRDKQPAQIEWLQLTQRGQACCKHCTKNQPCGNSCISTKKRCHQPPGCAC
jgi:hypothetical protein